MSKETENVKSEMADGASTEPPSNRESIDYICDGCGDVISEEEATLFDGWCEYCFNNQ